ncbi:MAG: cupin domain-containing protein [Candidatus Eremiobacteraeota bacterium]|nr:cupin domain-containing protein [Candidatus Eremiobacteraeota bacterium]
MQKTIVPDVWTWKRWQPDRSMDFNSWFIKGDKGNVVVDPLEPDTDDLKQIDGLGGASWVAITNRDHERATRLFVERFDAKVAAGDADADGLGVSVTQRLGDGELFHGWRVIGLDGFKTRGEIALYSGMRSTVILGDSLWGDPAGSLRFTPDDKLGDPQRAVLSMRRVRGVPRLDNVLVGDGVSIYGNGRAVVGRCIDARNIVEALRINLDQVPMREDAGPGNYSVTEGEVGFLLGAERLGYRIVQLEPGTSFCPTHWHTQEEELFVIWSGEPTLLTPHGRAQLREGDCIAFPCGEMGAHKVRNDGSALATILMISNVDAGDVCFYPDSRKLLVEREGLIVRSEPALDYFDGE